AGIIPSTNPTSTAIFKILIAVKSRNSIVLSPHPSAAKCINETARVMREAGVREGLPAEAVGCMTSTSLEGTEALMKHRQTAVILATGGIGLVRAAYSSGKPAFGVGPGNVPVFVERSADVPVAVQNILTGKTFDNGTICASEQAVVADAPVAKQVREEFVAQGAHFLSAAEAEQLAKVVTTEKRALNPAIVGRSVETIAKMAGLTVPQGTRCLVAEVGGVGRDFPLSMEKLSPILAFYVEDGLERGAARCFEILSYGGMGHTAGIHTRSREAAKAFGIEMPASRIVVNSPTTHGAIGFSTALPPSMTLGCGSWGGNVTSDNVSPWHLMDIKRVAFETRAVPSKRPARTAQRPAASPLAAAPAGGGGGGSSTYTIEEVHRGPATRDDIVKIVDRFLSQRQASQPASSPLPVAQPHAYVQQDVDVEPQRATHSGGAAPHPEAAPTAQGKNGGGNGHAPQPAPPAPAPPKQTPSPAAASNGKRAVDFVCEDDVRRAIQKGEKIYINARTIITPAARDMGEAAEVFAKA
ncbi:MAG: aldehyde dehydrogenase family protein, partial [Acidobacteria bacterium]|nr:aldehyde dehydrogenase family protein [Acidobacteriota bacterium]